MICWTNKTYFKLYVKQVWIQNGTLGELQIGSKILHKHKLSFLYNLFYRYRNKAWKIVEFLFTYELTVANKQKNAEIAYNII